MYDGDGLSAERQQADELTPRELDTKAPITPAFHSSRHVNPSSNVSEISSPPQRFKDSTDDSPQWNANYIAPTKSTKGRRPSSPTEVAAGARSPEELLRRLSLAVQRPRQQSVTDVDPRLAHPGLSLSGNVISATFCVPYKINYAPDGEWVCMCGTIY